VLELTGDSWQAFCLTITSFSPSHCGQFPPFETIPNGVDARQVDWLDKGGRLYLSIKFDDGNVIGRCDGVIARMSDDGRCESIDDLVLSTVLFLLSHVVNPKI